MSKMKVYELAKELGKSSKELLEFLSGKNIEVKSHMSSIEDKEIALARNAFGGKHEGTETEKPAAVPKAEAEAKTETAAPKKKNIVRVFRPQNTRDGGRGGNRQGVRPGAGGRPMQNARPMQVQNGRPAPGTKPMQNAKPMQVQNGRPAPGSRQVQSEKLDMPKEQPERIVKPETKPQQVQPESVQENKPAESLVKEKNVQESGAQSAQAVNNSAPQNHVQNDRPQGERRQDNRPGRGDRPQGERFQGGRGDKDRDGFRGDRDRQGRKNNPAIPAPAIEGQKTQRSKGKGKDDYKKKDYRDDDERMPKGKKQKNEPKQQLQKPQQKMQKVEEVIKSVVIPEVLTIKDLADKMKIVPSVIVKKLFMQGKIVTVNQEIDYDTAEEIALEFDVLCEKEEVVDVIEELLKEEEEDEKKMKKRPPVVCVMGHVDHGKTSLLDAIRHTNVIDREAGGITQHIGASVVKVNGEKITFLDTPGHEAFTAMRMRGASSTDIAILVVAADDGVMPQTVEAINHAKAAGIEIVVAINKIDKPSANIDRVKQELSEYELIPEDWGGSTIFVPVSAKTGEGLQELMEMLLLTAEMSELKANPNRRARGLVIEAELDKGKGSVATVLVQKGTLRVGDAIAAGSAFGKVRAMMDDKGRRVKEAGPSVPVEILGLNDVPNAGEVFVIRMQEALPRHLFPRIKQSFWKILRASCLWMICLTRSKRAI